MEQPRAPDTERPVVDWLVMTSSGSRDDVTFGQWRRRTVAVATATVIASQRRLRRRTEVDLDLKYPLNRPGGEGV